MYLFLRHSRGFSPLPSCVEQAYVQLSQLALERRANADLEGEALAMSWDLFNANDENDHLNATLLKTKAFKGVVAEWQGGTSNRSPC